MKPTQILKNEHRVIEQVLNCLEKIVENGLEEKKIDKKGAWDAIEFFRHFADQCHHGKEEDCLFPMLEARGFSRSNGPTGVMFHEHEIGRRCIRGMRDSLEGASQGDSVLFNQFIEHAQGYIELLRDHIQKEDHCLFVMAEQVLDSDEELELMNSFQKVESEEIGEGIHEKYINIANELAERYGVPCAPVEASPCHHHGSGV